MQETASKSMITNLKSKCQQIVPEYNDRKIDNPQIDSKHDEELKKEFDHFGTNKQKSHSREFHILQVNESLLYDTYESTKDIEAAMEPSDTTTISGNISRSNSLDGPIAFNNTLEIPKEFRNSKNDAITPGLDSLKDFSSITPIFVQKRRTMSSRVDDGQSELSSAESFSHSTTSISTNDDESKILSSEQQLLFENDKKAIYR